MTTCTKLTKPLQCHCIQRPRYETDEYPAVAGLVEINDTLYTLTPLGKHSGEGYRLVNLRSGNVYDLDTSSGYPLCDCPDCTYRQHPCKHCLALKFFRNTRTI